MKRNLKRVMKEGRSLIGTFVFELTEPSIPKILSRAGFDFIVIDM